MPKLHFSSVKFTKGRVFVIGFFLVMLLAIPTTVFLVGQQLQTTTKAEKSTTLSFDPITRSVSVGENAPFDIILSPGTNLVNYVKLTIDYDPAVFSADENSFTLNPPSKMKLIDGPSVASGSVSMTFSTSNPTGSIDKESKLGTITFGVISDSTSEAQLSFDQNLTQVRSLGSTDSILENVFLRGNPATVTISSTTPPDNNNDSGTGAGVGAPTLISPSSNEEVSNQTPSFEGTAQPNETVSITIHSTQEITAEVTADSNGNWSYTPTTSLSPGTHTVTISANDSGGVLQTITQTFSVLAAQAEAAGGTIGSTPTCTDITSDVDATGNAPYTIGFTVNGTDDTGTITKVTFNFGDVGTLDVTQGGGIGTASVSATATHTYETAGSFTASAVLTNDQGALSDSASCTLGITITGSGSAILSPIPATGPSGVVVGIGILGALIAAVGVLLFFVF